MINDRIKNLLPNDIYKVEIHHACQEDFCLSLTHLYQPLIGLQAVSLYLTLLNEAKLINEPTTHHTVMNMTNLDLDQFYQSRIKLEAIGLLKTYVEELDIRKFYYILYPPFSIQHFFEDSMLAILLEHHVGKAHFSRLKKRLLPQLDYPADVIETTKTFGEVFSTTQPKVVNLPTAQVQDKPSAINKNITLSDDIDIDFDWIEHALRRNQINPANILTRENKTFITNLVKIYHLDNLSLEKAILWSINEEHMLLHDELHEACKDFYVKQFNSPNPRLVPQQEVQAKESNGEKKQPQTKMDKLIEHFERITHREILEDFSQSGQASENEIKMITNIMLKHGLSQSVMNVLVHYVLQKSDMKLTRNYVEKIATHWARKNVKNARQAMELAKSETKLYQSWSSKRPVKKQEVLPDWFAKYDEPEKAMNQDSNKKRDILKEKQELEKALKNVSTKF